jgi:diguanylate cyclase (GGDEF)-like protein/PAS domain S-box-containing protein
MAVIMLLWLSMWGWFIVDLQRNYDSSLRAAKRVTNVVTNIYESHVSSVSQRMDIYLSELISNLQGKDIQRGNIQTALSSNLSLFPEVSGFRVANAKGEYIDAEAGAANITDQDYFRELRDNPLAGLVISNMRRHDITGEWIILFGRRLEDEHGNFTGAILGAVRCQSFADFARDLNIMPSDMLVLRNSNMELVARYPVVPEQVGLRLEDPQSASLDAVLATLAKGEQDGYLFATGPLDDIERLYYFRKVRGQPFVIVAGLAKDPILTAWQNRAIVYLVLGSIITLIAILFARSGQYHYRRMEEQAEQLQQEMEDKNREWRALLDSMPDPVWLIDMDERWLAVNEPFCKALHVKAEDILGRHVDEVLGELVSREDMEALKVWRQAFYTAGVITPQVFWLQLKEHKKVPYEIRRVPIFDDDGKVRGLAAAARELSDRYEAKTHQQLLAQIFEHNTGGMLMIDAERNIVTSNQVFANFLDYSPEEIQGVHLRKFISREHHDEELLDSIIRRLHAKIIFSGEIWLLCKDGSAKPFDCRVVPLVNEQQTDSWLLFVNDLSAHKAAEEHIDSLMHKDALTGLPNRNGFLRGLEARLQKNGEYALLVLGLDQFTRINDAYGHRLADYLLRRVAKRIRRLLREQDFVGRLGDNQFAVLAAHVDAQSVEKVIRKVLSAIVKPVLVDQQSISCTACIGISLAPRDGWTAGVLLQNADTAMHHAHDIGPGTYHFFSQEMNTRLVSRLYRETGLRMALERQELTLYYQPQVDVRNGNIVGCEALLRWNHPEMGLVPPLEFIPLAEDTGLILPIGNWVLEEACRQNKAWQEQGLPPITVAVNLSAVQFLDAQIGEHITHALQTSGLEARWLELEITESVLMRDPERVVSILEGLKKLGIRLSIDDFGTGYSSLAYLKRFPIDKIKIDQSFIRDVCTSANDAAIVRMVLGMARELRLQAIAEGVEGKDQLSFLVGWQCHEYQGYLCSRPVPADDFETLLRNSPRIVGHPYM